MTAPSHTKEYIAAQNHKDYLRTRAWRRSFPDHPSHKFPDDLIAERCEQWVTKRRAMGKTTVYREDIYCEIICPDDGDRAYHRIVEGRIKKYIKQMVTIYMNRNYPVLSKAWWDISRTMRGEPCHATTAGCPTE